MNVTAEDERLRYVLAEVSKVALLGQGVLGGETEERAILLRNAGINLKIASEKVIAIQTEVGSKQSVVESSVQLNQTSIFSLQLLKSDTIGVDEYETATDLQSVELQLQGLYAITARVSRLSLLEYL